MNILYQTCRLCGCSDAYPEGYSYVHFYCTFARLVRVRWGGQALCHSLEDEHFNTTAQELSLGGGRVADRDAPELVFHYIFASGVRK